MNNVSLIGRLTSNPELRFLQNGTAITRFSLAVEKIMSSEKKKLLRMEGKKTADYPRIVVWGKQGENCATYLTKGKMVGINGRLITNSYQTQDGVKRFVTEVHANEVRYLDPKPASALAPVVQVGSDDDLPF